MIDWIWMVSTLHFLILKRVYRNSPKNTLMYSLVSCALFCKFPLHFDILFIWIGIRTRVCKSANFCIFTSRKSQTNFLPLHCTARNEYTCVSATRGIRRHLGTVSREEQGKAIRSFYPLETTGMLLPLDVFTKASQRPTITTARWIHQRIVLWVLFDASTTKGMMNLTYRY